MLQYFIKGNILPEVRFLPLKVCYQIKGASQECMVIDTIEATAI